MKKLIVLLALFAMPVAGSALMLSEGMNEAALSGVVDLNSAAGTKIDLDLFYGRFITDDIEAGGTLTYRDDNNYTLFAIGPAVDYNFDTGMAVIPYVGAACQFAQADLENDDHTALDFGLEGGVKVFVTECIAVSAALKLDYATESIYQDKDHLTDNDARIEIGLRAFF